MNLLDPEKIYEEFLPKLQQIVQESNGRIKDYYIYPQHRPGGLDLIYDYGRRRYPKRLKEFTRKPEDRAIYLNGIEVGFMISRVPYLHTDTWAGQGISIQIQNGSRPSIGPEQARPVAVNPKKRKRDDLGQEGEQNERNQIKNALIGHLSFLREEGISRDFKVDRYHQDDQYFMVSLNLDPRRKLNQLKMQTTKRITILNSSQKKNALKINIKSQGMQGRSQETFIDNQFNVPIGSVWTLSNESAAPAQFTLKISKSI